jgi:hypothetical protein
MVAQALNMSIHASDSLRCAAPGVAGNVVLTAPQPRPPSTPARRPGRSRCALLRPRSRCYAYSRNSGIQDGRVPCRVIATRSTPEYRIASGGGRTGTRSGTGVVVDDGRQVAGAADDRRPVIRFAVQISFTASREPHAQQPRPPEGKGHPPSLDRSRATWPWRTGELQLQLPIPLRLK